MSEALLDSPLYGLTDITDLKVNTTQKLALNQLARDMNCDFCGEQFSIKCNMDEYCYKFGRRGHRHRGLFFCSDRCLRLFEQSNVDKIRQKQGAPREKWRESRKAALERKEHCERKLIEFEKAMNSSQTSHDRHIAQRNIYNWRFRLKEVEAFLKEGEK